MIDQHKDPPHTFIVTIDKPSMDNAKRNPSLHIAMTARLMAFTSHHETVRPDGWHYMKRSDEPTRCISTN